MHLLCTLFIWASAQASDPQALLDAQSGSIAKASDFGAPVLNADLMDKIRAGETVWTDTTLPDGERLLMISGLVNAPSAAIWVAILDDAHNGLSERITENQLQGSVPGKKRLYQHLALPYPVSDRHWVLNILTDIPLYKATGGKLWRRAWDLDPMGEGVFEALGPKDRALIKSGVWTPKNRGEWLILPAGEQSLVIYRGLFDIGGRVPASLSQAMGSQSALDLFNQLQHLADGVPAHYDSQHSPILAPTGQMIPPW
jgi:hypothetical protein